MKISVCTIMLCIVLVSAHGQPPLSDRVANYEMHVRLDTDHKMLDGRTRLEWKNPSGDTIRELQFHLYLNAFKNSNTTWIREGREFMAFVGEAWYDECRWGWVSVDEMHDTQGNSLTSGFEFIRPEDDNPYDESVLRVPLVVPVLPHDTASFDFDWSAMIPKAMIRTGYNKDFYFLAQWFPKLGVYEPAGMRFSTTGAWNCHQYHANGEYYADFGNYLVHLDVPSDFHIAASGILKDTVPGDSNRMTWTFSAQDVIDFTWTTSPNFIIVNDRWKNVDINIVMYPDHRRFAPRYLDATHNVLSFMDENLGVYPYPQITVIDPPIHGIYVGGMEYPMLITSVSTVFLPKAFKSIETLVVHEFIHQYFMQMVATNEQEEAWMDEGITSYYESRIMDEYYGPHSSMSTCCGFGIGNLEFARNGFFSSGHAAEGPNTYNSWQFTSTGYSTISYDKVVLWLKTLEGLISTPVFDEVMRTYFERWKFKHPCREDFIEIANEVIAQRLPEKYPEGMDWYFDQVIRGTALCDYAVTSVSNYKVLKPLGYVENTQDCVPLEREPDKATVQYESSVIVQRLGQMQLPVEVEIRFDNGEKKLEFWDGMEGMHEFKYTGTARIVSAEIDPYEKIVLDYNVINNSRTAVPERPALRAYFVKCLSTIQQFMETLSFFV